MEYNNKVIWITGASDGIGKALAVQLAQKGALIILTARNKPRLEEVKSALESFKGSQATKLKEHLVYPMDLFQTKGIPADVKKLLQIVGQIDMVIHSAGVSQRSLVKDTAIEVDRKIMELNYFSILEITKALLPHMMQNGNGFIVSISSVAGKLGTPYRSGYCGAKHALIGFMDAVRAETYHDNIKVLVAVPGSIKTNISINALEGDGTRHGVTDPAIESGMPVEECARRIIKSIEGDKKEVIIAEGREKLAVYVKRFFPKLLFKMVASIKTT